MTKRRGTPRIAAVALLAGLLAPAQARAGTDACADATTQTQMNTCAGNALEAADKALNATYKAVTERLGGESERRKLLVAAEKHWLAFRDAECDFEASSSVGGSVHPMVVMQCKTTLTQAHAQTLRAMLACQEGDLSCPLPPK